MRTIASEISVLVIDFFVLQMWQRNKILIRRTKLRYDCAGAKSSYDLQRRKEVRK